MVNTRLWSYIQLYRNRYYFKMAAKNTFATINIKFQQICQLRKKKHDLPKAISQQLLQIDDDGGRMVTHHGWKVVSGTRNS